MTDLSKRERDILETVKGNSILHLIADVMDDRYSGGDNYSSDQHNIAEVGLDLVATLIRKNIDYGSSALTPPLLCTKLSASDAILVRMSDKIKRMEKLISSRESRVTEESLADTIKDLGGYSILWGIAYEKERRASINIPKE